VDGQLPALFPQAEVHDALNTINRELSPVFPDPKSHHHVSRELFQVTVRHHASQEHVTLPISCLTLEDSSAKQSYRFGRDLSHLHDILWPLDRPLPYPAWGAVPSRLSIDNMKQFEALVNDLTLRVQKQLETHCYNTIGNFLTLYESFHERSDPTQSLEEFYRAYIPPITSKHHTCVGLGLDLTGTILQLENTYPGIGSALFLASCEEDIGNVNRYVSTPTPDTRTSEKEHVVVSLKVELEGRVGVLLLDPGYHVAHPVVVMEDGEYPHTGWFKPGGTCRSRRTYNYTLHPSGRYVLWNVKDIRNGVEQLESAIIYTHQAFISPVNCTERRNLVYNFKSLLKRDCRGNVLAGVYFPLKPMDCGQFSLFYQDQQRQQVDIKIHFKDFLSLQTLSDGARGSLDLCGSQLGLMGSKLTELLYQTALALNDKNFMQQLLDINQRVVLLSENN
jgi:hypothetical protein